MHTLESNDNVFPIQPTQAAMVDRFDTTWTGVFDRGALEFGLKSGAVEEEKNPETGEIQLTFKPEKFDPEVFRRANIAFNASNRAYHTADSELHTGMGCRKGLDVDEMTRGEKLRLCGDFTVLVKNNLASLDALINTTDGYPYTECRAYIDLLLADNIQPGRFIPAALALIRKDGGDKTVVIARLSRERKLWGVMGGLVRTLESWVVEEKAVDWDWKRGIEKQVHIVRVLMVAFSRLTGAETLGLNKLYHMVKDQDSGDLISNGVISPR